MIVEQKKINKPWGHEIIWSHCDKFVGKILCLKNGHKLSRQYHEQKEETIFVLTGTLSLEIGTPDKDFEKINLKKGQSFHVTPNTVHRFCAPYGDVELAEVSTPELDDVVRLEDDYSRSE
jgi:mannose-6-phosphate isomerase